MRNRTEAASRSFFPAVVLFAIVAFAGVGVFAYKQVYSQRTLLIQDMNLTISRQVAEAMSLWLNEQKVQAATLAVDSLIVACAKSPNDAALRGEVEQKLERAHSLQPHLTLINLMIYRSPDDPPVTTVVRGETKVVGNGRSLVDSINGRSVGLGGEETFSYIRAVAEGSEAFISEAKPNAIPGLPPVFMIAVPVRDETGKLLGAIGYGVRIDYFTNLFVADFNMGAGGRMEILDDRGLFVGSSNPIKLLSREFQPQGQTLLPQLNPRKSTAFRLALQGTEYDFAASPVHMDVDMANRWWAVFHRSVEELNRESSGFRNWLIFFCAAGAALVAGIAFAASRVTSERLSTFMGRRTQVYVDSAPYGVLLSSEDGRILDVNPAACRLFGYSRSEMLELPLHALLPGSPAGGESTGDVPEGNEELPGRRKDGAELVVSCDRRPTDAGETVYFLRDDTERAGNRATVARLSENLAASLRRSEELRRKAEAADKAKSEFLANMSHEIRTPLNAILGLSHLMGQTRMDERQSDYIGKIGAASHTLVGVVNDVLDFAGLEAGRLSIGKIPFELPSLLEELQKRFAASAAEKGLGFTLATAADVPEFLLGDPARLRRVLENVLSNAVKFTSTGGVTLSCRRLGPAKGNGVLLEFRIQDTGIGIDDAHRKTLFQPFSQADGSAGRRFGGIGLGLIICRRVLTLMGGEISLESAPGKGTVVIILCPFGVSDADSVRASGPTDAAAAAQGLRNRTFLLAEDNPVNRQIAVELLHDVGAEVVAAADGNEALACLAETPTLFDAVLMDLQMPGMDGYTATEEIRRQPRFKDLPIIAMTAHAMAEERERCFAVGMNEHISKPIDVDTLYITLARVLDWSAARRG